MFITLWVIFTLPSYAFTTVPIEVLDDGKVELNGILLAAVGLIKYGNPTPRFYQGKNIFVGV